MGWYRIKQTLLALALIAVIGLTGLAVSALAHGAKFLSVQSGSMVPTLHKGDLVFGNRVPVRQIAVGDIVTYTNPHLLNGQPITHRVIQTPTMANGNHFVTKGDANPAADPPIAGRNIIAQTHGHVPYLGYLVDFIRKPLGLILLIYLPALTVIVAEIRRLMQYYKDMEAYRAVDVEPHEPPSPGSRTVIRLSSLAPVVAILVPIIAVPTVHALTYNQVVLTGNSFSSQAVVVAPPPPTPPPPTAGINHLLVYQVGFNSGTAGTCLPAGSTAVISNTGAGSNNVITINNSCHISVNNSSNVNISTSNQQAATSGNARSGRGSDNANSGNASNSSSTSVTVNVSNGSSNTDKQTVTLYNPTDQTVNLAGWQLLDNASTRTIGSGTIAPKSYYIFEWPVANGLSRSGDRITLRTPQATTVDALSWGSDTSIFNPAVTTANGTTTISRKTVAADTDTAADWQVAP